MTTSQEKLIELTRLLDRTKYLLLDFDGPICSIFTGVRAPSMANELRALAADAGLSLPEHHDPFEIFRGAATADPGLAHLVESALRSSELDAAHSACPTPGAREVITACHQSGRTVAVVSNNSAVAVEAYLAVQGLADHLDLVVGRDGSDATLLKPNPHLLLKAAQALDAEPRTCTLVGDSIFDIEGARSAGMSTIGYANKPGKYEELMQAGAGALITNMHDLATQLLTNSYAP